MKISLGQCLAEYGFQFYEKIHEPIFLISKLGKIVKVNEAGRKLISIAHLSFADVENLIEQNPIFQNITKKSSDRIKLKTDKHNLNIIASNLADSNYVLLEIKR